jgi:hypothetical protein
MAGRLRRLLRTVPRGRVDLGQVATLAAQARRPGAEMLTPSAALVRNLLAERLEVADPQRCCVVGPGRLVSRATLPFDCRMRALRDIDHDAGADLDWLVVGDALAAEDDPPASLSRLADHLKTWPQLRMLVVLPGTALLPDDEQPCPRRWLFSRVSGETMARTVLAGRALTVSTLGSVLAASADLLGFAADRLWPEELVANDPEYPMVVVIATSA